MLRMDRNGRLQSARSWLAAQRGRPAERIARSYRKRYGVDWSCAIAELSVLGIAFDPKWREQLDRTLEGAKRTKACRQEEQAAARACPEFPDSDEHFAFIAGFTDGGAAFGTTWAEYERGTPLARLPKRDALEPHEDESLPF